MRQLWIVRLVSRVSFSTPFRAILADTHNHRGIWLHEDDTNSVVAVNILSSQNESTHEKGTRSLGAQGISKTVDTLLEEETFDLCLFNETQNIAGSQEILRCVLNEKRGLPPLTRLSLPNY